MKRSSVRPSTPRSPNVTATRDGPRAAIKRNPSSGAVLPATAARKRGLHTRRSARGHTFSIPGTMRSPSMVMRMPASRAQSIARTAASASTPSTCSNRPDVIALRSSSAGSMSYASGRRKNNLRCPAARSASTTLTWPGLPFTLITLRTSTPSFESRRKESRDQRSLPILPMYRAFSPKRAHATIAVAVIPPPWTSNSVIGTFVSGAGKPSMTAIKSSALTPNPTTSNAGAAGVAADVMP